MGLQLPSKSYDKVMHLFLRDLNAVLSIKKARRYQWGNKKSVNRRTDNTMTKRKKGKNIYKIPHKKLKVEQIEAH
jgi:hypothetical protein